MQKILSIGRSAALWAITLILLAGCSKDDKGAAPQAYLATETVNSNATELTAPVRIITWGGDGDMAFSAAIADQSGDETWCSFASFTSSADAVLVTTGRVGSSLYLHLLENQSDVDRRAIIRIDFASGATETLVLTQLAYSPTALFDRRWGEQPDFRENNSYIYKTYYTTLQRGGYVRNYSVCFDKSLRVSHCVAYPLTSNYVTPSVGRTNLWSYDPNEQLPVIERSWQSDPTKTYGTGDARGHQCPSADRYSTRETNAMTFYAPNIMPQNYEFNGGVWVDLEEKVRENMRKYRQDTIFVVTGTYFTGKTIRDRDGKTVGYPSNCWKVLLRATDGKAVWECSAGELRAIGFWFANDGSNNAPLREYATTVADIETKTGFTFFRNLPAAASAAVKEQNRPSDWGL